MSFWLILDYFRKNCAKELYRINIYLGFSYYPFQKFMMLAWSGSRFKEHLYDASLTLHWNLLVFRVKKKKCSRLEGEIETKIEGPKREIFQLIGRFCFSSELLICFNATSSPLSPLFSSKMRTIVYFLCSSCCVL